MEFPDEWATVKRPLKIVLKCKLVYFLKHSYTHIFILILIQLPRNQTAFLIFLYRQKGGKKKIHKVAVLDWFLAYNNKKKVIKRKLSITILNAPKIIVRALALIPLTLKAREGVQQVAHSMRERGMWVITFIRHT